MSGEQSVVSGQWSAYFIQKRRLRYGHAARRLPWHRLPACDLTDKLIADN
ncbi:MULTISPECIES: hypothetical protein [unclassified Moorena]|nr:MULTISPECIES: hypothetical protein [unclassified Moorena]NEQ08274.1 hypothetical protein [Moorena sp. SIO4E2]NEQ14388.1 hypothetical protein [Moorena sp. SIO3E2]